MSPQNDLYYFFNHYLLFVQQQQQKNTWPFRVSPCTDIVSLKVKYLSILNDRPLFFVLCKITCFLSLWLKQWKINVFEFLSCLLFLIAWCLKYSIKTDSNGNTYVKIWEENDAYMWVETKKENANKDK